MLPPCLLTLATEVLPPLLSLGVQSVEVAYERGENRDIRGIQFRGANGYRIGRHEIPLGLAESLEHSIATLIESELDADGDGVVECRIPERKVLCRHTPNDERAIVALEWEL